MISREFDIKKAKKEIEKVIESKNPSLIKTIAGTQLHNLKRYHGCDAANGVIADLSLTDFGINYCDCGNCDHPKK